MNKIITIIDKSKTKINQMFLFEVLNWLQNKRYKNNEHNVFIYIYI